MQESKRITISCKRKEVTIEVGKILYILMKRNSAEIHVVGDKVYSTRRTYGSLTKELDESFVLPAAAVSVSIFLLSFFLLKKRKKRLAG